MTPVWGKDEAVSRWVARRIPGCERGFGECRALAVVDEEREKLVGGVVYHNWEPGRQIIEISGASETPRWLTRRVLWAMFHYPFLAIGCQLVVMRVSEENQMWNGRGLPRLLKSYGFNEYRIPRLFGRDEGGIVFTLSDDDWKANGFHKKELRQ